MKVRIKKTAFSIFLIGMFLFSTTAFSENKEKLSPSKDRNTSKKHEKQQIFIPAEKIKADQAVAFPTDI